MMVYLEENWIWTPVSWDMVHCVSGARTSLNTVAEATDGKLPPPTAASIMPQQRSGHLTEKQFTHKSFNKHYKQIFYFIIILKYSTLNTIKNIILRVLTIMMAENKFITTNLCTSIQILLFEDKVNNLNRFFFILIYCWPLGDVKRYLFEWVGTRVWSLSGYN